MGSPLGPPATVVSVLAGAAVVSVLAGAAVVSVLAGAAVVVVSPPHAAANTASAEDRGSPPGTPSDSSSFVCSYLYPLSYSVFSMSMATVFRWVTSSKV